MARETAGAEAAGPGAAGPPERLLEALDPEQREVASTLLGPVCVLAGAGTGKTRAITHRIAYGVRTGTYSPTAVLAVTFTTRAAGEMRARLRQLGAPGVQARTFHSAALRQLTYFLPKVTRRRPPRLVEHKAPLVAQAAARLGFEVDRAAIRDLAAEIEWAKVQLWTAEDYQAGAEKAGRGQVAGHDAVGVARLMGVYERILAEAEAMDFEDVLLATCGLLEDYPQVADQVRGQYRHFVVDEYQDVSPVQQRLLDLWLGGRREVCVVGDPNQTIYSFAGASARPLLDFPRHYPGAPVIRLVRDYRSTPEVVSLANRTLGFGAAARPGGPAVALVRDGIGGDALVSRAVGAGARAGVELVAQLPSGPPVLWGRFADDVQEAEGVVREIRRLVAGGVRPADVAILFRTNGQSEPFETALDDARVAYQVRGGQRFFTRQEVRQAVALLRSEARVQAASGQGATVLERVHDALGAAGWRSEPPAERGATRDKWESLDALERLARELIAGGATTLRQVVDVIVERAAQDHAPEPSGVTLASLHAAKGLEWEAVFLAGLSDGLLPISLATSPAEVAEERRLLYVGV
ncbi:MAG: ATP-dependent helicase, partial [Bifidobacteriaceae bacterium]|nr:ATP-dependent helicase [Bifidobacteriaceae bacterium]